VLKKILAYKSCHHTTFRCKNITKKKKERRYEEICKEKFDEKN